MPTRVARAASKIKLCHCLIGARYAMRQPCANLTFFSESIVPALSGPSALFRRINADAARKAEPE